MKSKGHSRCLLARIIWIHEKIRMGNYPSAGQLADELEVSAKTVQRDLDFLRDFAALPLEYDRARRGWHYTHKLSGFFPVAVNNK